MIIEPIENNESAEFAQICMKWLNSNEPTLTVKDRNGKPYAAALKSSTSCLKQNQKT